MPIIKLGKVKKQREVDNIALCPQTPYNTAKQIVNPWYHKGIIYGENRRGHGESKPQNLFWLKLGKCFSVAFNDLTKMWVRPYMELNENRTPCC